MELVFTIILLVLVLLFYLSNPHNKINKWCSMAGILFWLGAAKEAVLYNIIPLLRGAEALQALFMPIYSVCTWALYTLAMPTTLIFALYFCDMDKTRPARLRLLKGALYLPALVLSVFFPPLIFRAYQLSSLPFWVSFAIYNLSAVAAFTVLMIRGVRTEPAGKSRTQKKQVRLVVLPPVIFWATSVFLTHPFSLQHLFKLWEVNAIFLLIGVAVFIVMAFRDGVMGLRLSGETYNWSSDMQIVSKGTAYTSHMLKNQTAKMEWCLENLRTQYSAGDPPEELAILSRSISALKDYADEMKKHSERIELLEEPCRLRDLIEAALSAMDGGGDVPIGVADAVCWLCDKAHMTEVFVNLVSNAIEAARGEVALSISGSLAKGGRMYLLRFIDKGVGMTPEELESMFLPYFTTKNTEKNFGLGLAYCKNVIEMHGGTIKAESTSGHGTTVTICLPARRVAMHGGQGEGTVWPGE